MVPSNIDAKLTKLVTGRASFKSANLGFNLLLSRVQKKYSGDPSNEVLRAATQEIHDFLEKYGRIMESEFPKIAGL